MRETASKVGEGGVRGGKTTVEGKGGRRERERERELGARSAIQQQLAVLIVCLPGYV